VCHQIPFPLYRSACSHCWRQETVRCLQTDNLAVRSGPVCWYWQLIYGSIKSESCLSEMYHLVTTCRVRARCGTVWHYMWHCMALCVTLYVIKYCTEWQYMWHCMALCVTLYVIKCGTVYHSTWHYVCLFMALCVPFEPHVTPSVLSPAVCTSL